jgi:acyl-CoA hydrolase
VRTVVTEYGVAELFGRSVRERAAALIAIAHPDFRDELAREARRLYHV